MSVTRETLIDALNGGALIPLGSEAAVSLAVSGDPSPSCISLKRGGDKHPTFHIDFDHLHAAVVAPLEAHVAHLLREASDQLDDIVALQERVAELEAVRPVTWMKLMSSDGETCLYDSSDPKGGDR